jgi:hypothetical protein
MKLTYRHPVEREVFFGHEVINGNELLRNMRKLGIPVLGILTPTGIAHGTLTVFTDQVTKDRVFEWEGDAKHVIKAAVEDEL